MHKVHRYHDICAGHRVTNHESKCQHLHGHNYRIHFTCVANGLDDVGRVIDFSVVKERLCMWLEDNWDHKFLAWEKDPLINRLLSDTSHWVTDGLYDTDAILFENSIMFVPFNPTAENMAKHLTTVVGPAQLAGTGISLVSVTVEETAKCSATFTL
jgi:6-pyruvoyltetrahydropterin/6-carboxytetrahydropterin synthase